MEVLVLFLILASLLALNAFFVMAEFAVVKLRPSKVQELAVRGEVRAALLESIQRRLDEYLSVCQVGITLASVALGMVGERLAAVLMGGPEGGPLRYAIAIAVSYVLVSGSHIVLAELVPKSVAIRIAEWAALFSARPLRFFHVLFFPALWVLTHLANFILRLMKVPPATEAEHHSEEELRILLGESQEHGMMTFRRLLFMENVFDFGGLAVRDAMRPRAKVRTLHTRHPWAQNLQVIRSSRFSRYPLLMGDMEVPVGFIHVKDLVIRAECDEPDLTEMVRPVLRTPETSSLEVLLGEMQRKRVHAAIVLDEGGAWSGFITLEDIQEELVGTIRDEFEDEEPVRLRDALSPAQIQLDIQARTPAEAIREALSRMEPGTLPLAPPAILHALQGRGRLTGTEVRHRIGMPQARVPGLKRPFVLILRARDGIRCEGSSEPARLLVVLLTPAGEPRIHHRLQTILVTILQESEYVRDRLLTADSPAEILEALQAGEQAALD